LRSALLVNPYDVDGMATTLEQAINLDSQEARKRMSAMRRALARNTVFDWAESFIRELKRTEIKK
jgi:trehalose 6-phosphate synthase